MYRKRPRLLPKCVAFGAQAGTLAVRDSTLWMGTLFSVNPKQVAEILFLNSNVCP